ncbi:ADP-ribosylation factor-like protein [Chloropicon primus]|uniref:ADP-ribosylation factor-like protein n=1 Tax=Chloropicon primus TaxID=1764295 RepID=A0A5B8MX45_9CHLO|nr:ADP-ribosylation factor-like protein [Chloropicon primus]UPR03361.1 ADP-ribosylation factor-like protein [Chloropicon primus]|eukprot:QDZ24152.1 ADP-ribosylation factor-like protein [Chloropicon primus]
MFGLMRNLYQHFKKKGAPRSFTLVFLGLDKAGKTTCMAALKGEPTEDASQTWGFNSEKVELSNVSVEVYDLGGGSSIRRIWENYYAEVHGIIFVVDASDEARLSEAKTAFQEATSHAYARGKPLLVCANKQDLTNTMTANDLTDYLELDALKCNHLCVECSAKGKEGSTPSESFMEGVRWLVHTANVQYTSLEERIKTDVRIEKEKQEKKMAERRERVEKMKALRQEESKRAEEEAKHQEQAEGEKRVEKDDMQMQQSPSSLKSSSPIPKPGSPEAVYAVKDVESPEEPEGSPDLHQEEAQLPGVIGD